MSDHYPSPKEALLGNGHIANLYCAIKWFTWQIAHIIFAAALVIVVPPFYLADRINVTPPRAFYLFAAGVDRIVGWIAKSVIGDAFWYALIAMVAVIGMPLWIAIGFDKYVYQGSWLQSWLHTTSDTAKQTPGVRRVYGECPVSMDLEPRWFDRLQGWLDMDA